MCVEDITIDDIIRIPDSDMRRTVLRRIDWSLLPKALKGASEEVTAKFLNNMPTRLSREILEEIESLGSVPASQVDEARRGILEVIKELRVNGEISFLENIPPEEEESTTVSWKPPWEISLEEVDLESIEGIARAMAILTKNAREDGILGLEAESEKVKDPIMKKMLDIVISTPDPEAALELIEIAREGLLRRLKLKLELMSMGIIGITQGETPNRIVDKLCLHAGIVSVPDLSRLPERVDISGSLLELPEEDIIAAIYKISIAARRDGIVGVEAAAEGVENREFAMMLGIVIGGPDLDAMRDMIEIYRETHLEEMKRRLKAIEHGIRMIVKGAEPRRVYETVMLYVWYAQ